MELITPSDDAPNLKGRDKASKGFLWDDVEAAVLKAHEVISVDNLSPLGVRPSHELISSHVYKVVQV